MSDQYGNSTTDAGTLLLGALVTSDIEDSSDLDWFRVALTGGTTYRFELRGNDAFLKLFDTDGLELTNRVATRDGIAALTFTPLFSGDYYLEVDGRREEWSYTLQAAVAPIQDDFRNDIATAGIVSVGGEATGTIEVEGDQDWFRVALEAETTYTFDLHGIAGGEWTHDSLVVRLFDASGADLGIGARSGAEGVASLTYTPLTAGAYHVVVRKDGDMVDGSYTLQAAVAAVQDDFRNDVATAGMVTVGGQVTGNIEVPMDTDWFKVELVAGQTWQFELDGANGGGTAQHPALKLLHPDGVLGPTSRGGPDANPVYSHTAIASGTYYLAVSNAQDTGTYTLRASLDPFPRNFVGGTAGADALALSGGVDVIVGGSGIDTVTIDDTSSDYTIARDGSVIVVAPTGQQSDFLYEVERVQFNDRALAFDIGFDGNAGRALRTMGVIFGTDAPEMSAYLGKSLFLLDQGMSFEDFLQHNLDAVLGTDATSEEIVTLLYKNAAHRDPPAQAMDFYTALLDDGIFTPGGLGVYAANTTENYVHNVISYVGFNVTSLAYTDYAPLA